MKKEYKYIFVKQSRKNNYTVFNKYRINQTGKKDFLGQWLYGFNFETGKTHLFKKED